MTPNRVGMLVVRAWVEAGSSSPLRARVSLTTDVRAGIERSVALAEVEAVLATVRAWLEEVLAPEHNDGGHAGVTPR